MAFEISSSGFKNLQGKVAIISGGSSGIGLAAAQLFSSHGALVTIVDLSPPSEPVVNSIFTRCDVTSWESILSAFEITIQMHGRVDILIANAGVGEVEDFFLDTLDEAGKLKQPKHIVLDINLKGVMDCVKVAVHYMKKQERGGAFVMTTSTAGYVGEKGLPAYSAAKHGLVGLMRALRPNLPKYNITINTVAPYMTESRLMTNELRAATDAQGIPINKAESVAKAMAYLVSKDLNGKTIFCAADKYTELEDSLVDTAPQWLGEENFKYVKLGEMAILFPNKSGI